MQLLTAYLVCLIKFTQILLITMALRNVFFNFYARLLGFEILMNRGYIDSIF